MHTLRMRLDPKTQQEAEIFSGLIVALLQHGQSVEIIPEGQPWNNDKSNEPPPAIWAGATTPPGMEEAIGKKVTFMAFHDKAMVVEFEGGDSLYVQVIDAGTLGYSGMHAIEMKLGRRKEGGESLAALDFGPQPKTAEHFIGTVFHGYDSGMLVFRTPGGGPQRGIYMDKDGVYFNVRSQN